MEEERAKVHKKDAERRDAVDDDEEEEVQERRRAGKRRKTLETLSESVTDPPSAGVSQFPKTTFQYGCFSKLWTSQMRRTLQTSTVDFCRVSYLFECNANDTYVLRMTHMKVTTTWMPCCFSSKLWSLPMFCNTAYLTCETHPAAPLRLWLSLRRLLRDVHEMLRFSPFPPSLRLSVLPITSHKGTMGPLPHHPSHP